MTLRVKMFYGSIENYNRIKSWEDVRPISQENNLKKALAKGDVVVLNHGYDETKSIYQLSEKEVEAAAEYRGGKFLGPVESLGRKGVLFDWECEHGHRFKASLEYVLLGGGWCSVCPLDKVQVSTTKANKFMSQILDNFNASASLEKNLRQ